VNKGAVEKTLLKGTPKQRAILLANHIAEVNMDGKGFLTEAEFTALSNSFKTDQEIAAYNRYRKVYDLLRNFLPNLSQARMTYQITLERLEKFILVRRSNYDFEDAINSMIELMPDKKTKDAAKKRIKHFSNMALLRSIETDKEVFIKATAKGGLLDDSIKEAKKTAKVEQIELKTGITLVKDYLSETGINVKVFAAFVKQIENWAKSKKGLSQIGMIGRTGSLNQAVKPFIDAETLEETPYDKVEIDRELYAKWKEDHFE
jgi:hypothetical protein